MTVPDNNKDGGVVVLGLVEVHGTVKVGLVH